MDQLVPKAFMTASSSDAVIQELVTNNEKIKKAEDEYRREVSKINGRKGVELKALQNKHKDDLKILEDERKRMGKQFKAQQKKAEEDFKKQQREAEEDFQKRYRMREEALEVEQAQEISDKSQKFDMEILPKLNEARAKAVGSLKPLHEAREKLVTDLQKVAPSVLGELDSAPIGVSLVRNTTPRIKLTSSSSLLNNGTAELHKISTTSDGESSENLTASLVLPSTSASIAPSRSTGILVKDDTFFELNADSPTRLLGKWKAFYFLREHGPPPNKIEIQIHCMTRLYHFLANSVWATGNNAFNECIKSLHISYFSQQTDSTLTWRDICPRTCFHLHNLKTLHINVDNNFWSECHAWSKEDMSLERKSIEIFFEQCILYSIAMMWRKFENITFSVCEPLKKYFLSADEAIMFEHFGEIAMRCTRRNFDDFGKVQIEKQREAGQLYYCVRPGEHERKSWHKQQELKRLDGRISLKRKRT